MNALLPAPFKERQIVSVREASAALGRARRTVCDLVEEGRLEAHLLPGRQKAVRRLSKRSVLLLYLTGANYQPPEFELIIGRILRALAPVQLDQLLAASAKERRRR